MPIRPIDLQVILPKSTSNPNSREHVVNKEALQLTQAQMANKRQSIEMDKKVNALKQKDGHKVEAKKDSNQQGKKKQAKPKPDSKSTEENKSSNQNQESVNEKKAVKQMPFNRFDMKV